MRHHRNRREELILAVHYPILNLIDAMEHHCNRQSAAPGPLGKAAHQKLIYVVLASQLMIMFIAIYLNYAMYNNISYSINFMNVGKFMFI